MPARFSPNLKSKSKNFLSDFFYLTQKRLFPPEQPLFCIYKNGAHQKDAIS